MPNIIVMMPGSKTNHRNVAAAQPGKISYPVEFRNGCRRIGDHGADILAAWQAEESCFDFLKAPLMWPAWCRLHDQPFVRVVERRKRNSVQIGHQGVIEESHGPRNVEVLNCKDNRVTRDVR